MVNFVQEERLLFLLQLNGCLIFMVLSLIILVQISTSMIMLLSA